jgi:hypothetical protein
MMQRSRHAGTRSEMRRESRRRLPIRTINHHEGTDALPDDGVWRISRTERDWLCNPGGSLDQRDPSLLTSKAQGEESINGTLAA